MLSDGTTEATSSVRSASSGRAAEERQAPLRSYKLYVAGKDLEGDGWVYTVSGRSLLEDVFTSVTLKRTGLSVHPFWGTDLLAGAESDEVRLEDVFVPDELVVRTSADDPTRLDDLQTAGFIWFVLLISAGYTGATAALVEEVVTGERGNPTERAALAISHEAAVALLEGAARAVRTGVEGEEAVAGALVARYTVQDALVANANRALELLGGMDFIKGSPNARLAASVRPLAFHPPARPAAAEPLLRYFAGGSLELA